MISIKQLTISMQWLACLPLRAVDCGFKPWLRHTNKTLKLVFSGKEKEQRMVGSISG
jgi:hypothetical protein